MSLGWVHLVYGVVLLTISRVTFGSVGLFVGIYLLLIWGTIFFGPRHFRMLFVAGIIAVAGLHLGRSDLPRRPGYRAACANNMIQITIALKAYHEDSGRYPPVNICDENGNSQHSWRVLILPYLGELALYESYDFEQPWNGTANRALLHKRPRVYSCPSNRKRRGEADTYTHYVAVVGPDTAWSDSINRKSREITNPIRASVLLVEATGPGIPWTKPQDLTVEEAIPILTSVDPNQTDGHRLDTLFSVMFLGRNVAMTDGSVHFIAGGVPRKAWRKLLRIDDGAEVTPKRCAPVVAAPRKIKVGNCVRLNLWIVVASFPLFWIFRRQRRQNSSSSEKPNA